MRLKIWNKADGLVNARNRPVPDLSRVQTHVCCTVSEDLLFYSSAVGRSGSRGTRVTIDILGHSPALQRCRSLVMAAVHL